MNRRKYSKSCQISEIRTYTLHGYEQKVLLEGESAESPLLLFLHGGPGSPIPFCAGSRGLFPEITKEFILVCWDQLGCGINDHVIDDGFSDADFTAMTVDLLHMLHRDFPNNPINLFGMSWGSFLAASAAAQAPELLHRVLVYGQITKQLFFNEVVFDALRRASLSPGKSALVDTLQAKSIDEITPRDMALMSSLIRKYTEGYQTKRGDHTPIGKMLWGLLTSPDYTLKDCKALVINGTRKNRSLFDGLLRLDLSSLLDSVRVPYLILQGDLDIVTPTRFVQELVSASKNQNLRFQVLPNSGHIPSGKGMDAVMQTGFAFLKKPATISSP